jgi:hypothetical protein
MEGAERTRRENGNGGYVSEVGHWSCARGCRPARGNRFSSPALATLLSFSSVSFDIPAAMLPPMMFCFPERAAIKAPRKIDCCIINHLGLLIREQPAISGVGINFCYPFPSLQSFLSLPSFLSLSSQPTYVINSHLTMRGAGGNNFAPKRSFPPENEKAPDARGF